MDKFSIGYQLTERYEFIDCVEKFHGFIDEVYFPWLGVGDGRGHSVLDVSTLSIMIEELRYVKQEGKKLNVLFNSTCYGAKELTNSFLKQITSVLTNIIENIGLDSITTTSLFVAKHAKRLFPELDIRASVNMNITTVQQMEYLAGYFDSFYVGRAINRNLPAVKKSYTWCAERGKKLFLLANSGCLKSCPAHMYHDNIVAHEYEIMDSNDFCEVFHGICWEWYANQREAQTFIDSSTWIRPEDIGLFSSITDGIKLATRTHYDPLMVIKAYAKKSYAGNMLQLCEPNHGGLFHLENSTISQDYIQMLT